MTILTTLSMHTIKVPISKLWELEMLGIFNPSQIERGDLYLKDFVNKMKILPDGRYEVELPWKYDSIHLPDNKEFVWRRHEKRINKFGYGDLFADCRKIFQDWEKLNIIERVPKFELNKQYHYLSHRQTG